VSRRKPGGLRSRRARFRGVGVGELLEVGDGAEGDEPGHVDVAEAAAALGLVHVVGGDEEGDTLAGELEEEVPEGAAGDGVDAGGRLVEEDDLGGVDDGAGEGEALLPAAGELRDATCEIGFEAGEGEEFLDAGVGDGRGEAVGGGVEVEVFGDGEVFVEAELLTHVADMALDVLAASLRMSMPRMVPVPSLGTSRPQRALMMVVLPEPLGPRKPKISPLSTSKLTSSTAVNVAEANGKVVGAYDGGGGCGA
jgi:hypothetical protein